MSTPSWRVSIVAAGMACVAVGAVRLRTPARSTVAPPIVSAPASTALSFREMFEPGPTLTVSANILALAGHRVRLVGYMAQMEMAPKGGFYLTPHPVRCDEAGGGTADLPPESVFVMAQSREAKEVPFMKGPLEVSGTWEVGNLADETGRVSAFRVRLDPGSASDNELVVVKPDPI